MPAPSPNLSYEEIETYFQQALAPEKTLRQSVLVHQTRRRSQLAHADFWLIFGATGCLLAITSSFIQTYQFEALIFTAITLLLLALIANLCRERQVILVTRPIIKIEVKFSRLFVPKIKIPSLRDLQHAHGVIPIDRR